MSRRGAPDGARPRPRRTERLVRLVSKARATAQRRATEVLERLPRPAQQAWRLTDRTRREIVDDRVPGLAAEAALFTLISLPALLLVVLGSLGFVAHALGPAGSAELQRIVFDLPRSVLSPRTYDAYAGLAGRVLEHGRADVVSIGALLSLWTGSRAVNRYLETITIAYDIERRAGWQRRLLALGLTLAGLLGAVAVLPLLVLGPKLIERIAPAAAAQSTLDVLGLLYWPGIVALVLVALASLYHVGVPWRTPWRRDLPGAVLAMTLWLLASGALRAYLAVSVRDDAVYGQLGTPIAVVLWLYVTAFAVLLGAELNAEIEKMWPSRRSPEEPRPPRIR